MEMKKIYLGPATYCVFTERVINNMLLLFFPLFMTKFNSI